MPPQHWNRTQAGFPSKDLPSLIDQQARRLPGRPAVIDQGKSTTYAQLVTRANQLAWHLRALGAGPDTRVAICTDRSAQMIVGLLGILKAGAAYVPLDPCYPKDRLSYMLEDAGIAALVTQERWSSVLPEVNVPTVRLDADRNILAAQSTDELNTEAAGENLAYVIYTSGSTGKPKGVAVRRCAFVNFLWAMKHGLEVCDRDAFLALTTISFDIAGLEIFLPLIAGGRIVLATREQATEAGRLVELIEREKVTVAQATPATWRMLLDSPWRGNRKLTILCGGEAMTRELADQLLTRSPRVWNMYGPTETTVWSTMCRIEPGDEPISIGRPIANTEVYILDAHLREVPVGEVGELHIGGVGLARGYLHRPELTAEKFIPHPFSDRAGDRLYKTGDLARYWPDGRIECLGRVDHQVKIRGYRIELPEIEARLGAHPEVKQAAVTALDDGQGDRYLSAYWVPRSSNPSHLQPEHLRSFLGEVLPPYMVPSIFVRMEALPLTPNGKIDRKALPTPDRQASAQPVELLEPETETQRRLVRVWEQLLGVKPIGIRDDFFGLGGHSLAAARIVARIESEMGVSLPVSTLLSSRTVEALARVVDGESEDETSGLLVPFRKTGTRAPLFMVAGVGGHVLIFREVAERLGEDQPVYGLQGIGLDGKEPPLSSMPRIAARYVREILSVQPEGPYYLSGWSMGGVIAYEIAQQMVAAGRELGALVIIDSYAPWGTSLADRLQIHWASFRKRSWDSKLAYLKQRLTHQYEVLARRLGHDRVEGLDGPMADRVRRSSLAQFQALREYQPRPFPGSLWLLRAEQTGEIRDPRADDPTLGWSSLVQGHIHVLPITGSHTGIFVGENVQSVIASLRTALSRSASTRPSPFPNTKASVSAGPEPAKVR